MLKLKLILIVGALLLKGFVVLGGASSPSISLKLSPLQGFSPFSTRGRVTIEPDPSNREWCLVWDAEEGESGVSCKPLEGEKGAKTHDILLRDLSSGAYVVKAVLIRGGLGEVWSNPVQVNVLKGGPE